VVCIWTDAILLIVLMLALVGLILHGRSITADKFGIFLHG